MWYGKLAVVLFLFSLFTLFSTFYINQVFNNPTISNSVTFTSLTSIMGSFNAPGVPNTTLIFGDFMSAYTIMINLFTGGIFADVFGSTGGVNGITQNSGISFLSDGGLTLLMGLMFDSSVVFFILYIVSNRSI